MDEETIHLMNMIMRIIFMIMAIMAMLYAPAKAQVVKWTYSAKKVGDKTYEVRLSAKVDEGWHIYSQRTPKGGPLPTTIVFTKNPLVSLNGKVKEEGEMDVYYDEVFGVRVYGYKDSVDFVQVVKLKSNAKTKVVGTVEFMACTRQQCLTPEKKSFSVVVGG